MGPNLTFGACRLLNSLACSCFNLWPGFQIHELHSNIKGPRLWLHESLQKMGEFTHMGIREQVPKWNRQWWTAWLKWASNNFHRSLIPGPHVEAILTRRRWFCLHIHKLVRSNLYPAFLATGIDDSAPNSNQHGRTHYSCNAILAKSLPSRILRPLSLFFCTTITLFCRSSNPERVVGAIYLLNCTTVLNGYYAKCGN